MKKIIQMAFVSVIVISGLLHTSHAFADQETVISVSQENGLVTRYLKALESRNLEDVVNLFTPEGVVYSPIYGKMPVRAFFSGFFKESANVEVTLRGLLGKGKASSGGAITGYWGRFSNLRTAGERDVFDVVAIMELDRDKISALHIVMDTSFLRPKAR